MSVSSLFNRFFPDPVRGRNNVALLAAAFMIMAILAGAAVPNLGSSKRVELALVVLIASLFGLSILCVVAWFVLLLFFSTSYTLKGMLLVIFSIGACMAVIARAPSGYNVLGLAGLLMLAIIVMLNIANKENSKPGPKL